jgi:C-terminal processing protease CtpA/Prc
VDIPEGEGILIEFMAEDGPAAKAGLAENDILLRFNNTGIKDVLSFRESLRKSRPGDQIRLDYLRKGKSGSVQVTLAPRPKDADSGDEKDDAGDKVGKKSSSSKRTVVVDGDGKVRIVDGDGADDPFEMLLKDPNVPAEMKQHIEEARKKMKELMPKTEK